jgi:hypothetical protein
MHKTDSFYETFGLNVVIDQLLVISNDHKLQPIVTNGGFYFILLKIHKCGWISAMLESIYPVK